jgi:hypothetical protein
MLTSRKTRERLLVAMVGVCEGEIVNAAKWTDEVGREKRLFAGHSLDVTRLRSEVAKDCKITLRTMWALRRFRIAIMTFLGCWCYVTVPAS